MDLTLLPWLWVNTDTVNDFLDPNHLGIVAVLVILASRYHNIHFTVYLPICKLGAAILDLMRYLGDMCDYVSDINYLTQTTLEE